MTDTSCREILHFLSKSIVEKNITKRLNDGTIRCYSAYYDGSSTAKTMDEKELFIIKTARKDEVKFSIMSLKEPEEANPERLKLALENLILKLGLNIERKNKGIFLSFLHSENCEKKFFFWPFQSRTLKKFSCLPNQLDPATRFKCTCLV